MMTHAQTLLCSLAVVLGLAPWSTAQEGSFALTCAIGSPNCQTCDFNPSNNCNCSRTDYFHWTDGKLFFDYDDELQSCAISGVAAGNTAELFLSCLQENPIMGVLTDTCNNCMVGVIQCTLANCSSECTSFQLNEDPACRGCVVQKCESAFASCAGFTTLSCDEDVCVPREVQIIPGLPNAASYAIFSAGGLIFCSFVGYLVYLSKCKRRPDEELLMAADIKDGSYQLPGPAPGTPGSMRKQSSQVSTGMSVRTPRDSRVSAFDRSATQESVSSYHLDDFGDDKPDI